MARSGSDAATRWLPFVALAFAVACGGGGGGGGGKDGSPDGGGPSGSRPAEVMLSTAQLYGEESLSGHSTTKAVALRHSDDGLEVLDFGENAAPSAFDAAPVFSSVDTAWAVGGRPDEIPPSLLRSDDQGNSWRAVAELPMPAISAMSLHVDRDEQGILTAWVAFRNTDEWYPGGPRVFARPVDGEVPWTEISGIPSDSSVRTAVLARRDGHLELLRQAYGPFSGDVGIGIDVIAGEAATLLRRIDVSFLADDYATFDDCGWVAGGQSAVLSACGASEWEIRALPDVGGRAHAIDFANRNRGVVCGDYYNLRNAFCFSTGDGGKSWLRSTVPTTATSFGTSDVALGPDGSGLGTFETVGYGAAVLATSDGGATWQEVALPPLASRVSFGRLARRSQAPDWSLASNATSVMRSPLPSPTTTAYSVTAASGPRAWAIGDSADRGPAITALLLTSDDAGRTWDEALSVPGGSFSGLAVVDRLHGWVVGAGRVFHTTDGGASFVEQTEAARPSDPFSRPFRVTAADAARAVLTVHGEIDDELRFTSDGGATWRPSALPLRAPYENRIEGGVCLTRTGAGVAVRYTEVLLTTDAGASWVAGPSFDFFFEGGGVTVSGSGFTGPLVACSGDADLWILVAATDPRMETLWHSPDGGVTWRNLTAAVGRTPDDGPTVGGFANERNAVLAVPRRSDDGLEQRVLLFRTRDGGDGWREVATPLAPNRENLSAELPEAIAFADPALGMMLTTIIDTSRPSSARHAVLTTFDGGDSWVRSELPRDFHPLGLGFEP